MGQSPSGIHFTNTFFSESRVSRNECYHHKLMVTSRILHGGRAMDVHPVRG